MKIIASSHIHIDHDALIHNTQAVKNFASRSKILAMVKANAYGHGLIKVAKTLENHVNGFGVARYEEALELIKNGITNKIVLMSGDIRTPYLKQLIKMDCDIVISSKKQFEQLMIADIKHRTTIWLKINTGMNRLGISLEKVDTVITKLIKQPWVKEIILMTHLSDAYLKNDQKTLLQCEEIRKIATLYSLPLSIANSAAVINYPQLHFDWVRPGIMLYGSSPFPNEIGSDHGLKGAMELNSFLFDIRRVYKGDQIGYGGVWTCPEDMLVGVVPIGYGDGYPLNINSGTPVWINGVLCPIVGKISMDLMSIDLRFAGNVKVGDFVQLWGKYLPIDKVARCANTTSYELLTRVSPRILSPL